MYRVTAVKKTKRIQREKKTKTKEKYNYGEEITFFFHQHGPSDMRNRGAIKSDAT